MQQSLLITGSNGSGKTSLLKCLGHIWDCYDGSIRYVNLPFKDIMFIPQFPHFSERSLGDQITYPKEHHGPVTNETLCLELLHETGLSHMIESLGSKDRPLNSVQNWQSRLSPGEKQRLIFCRILYNRPKLVFLDESTNSMDINSAIYLYTLLLRRGINYITVSHQPCLFQIHDTHLNLEEFAPQTVSS